MRAPDVTDRDDFSGGIRISQSVTSWADFDELLLQIEIFRRDGFGLSRSVTVRGQKLV